MSITREYTQLRNVNSYMGIPPSSGYCPISVKEEMNPPNVNYMDELTHTDMFLSQKNILYMTYYLTAMNKQNMTGYDTNNLTSLVSKMMADWAKKENLNNFNYVYSDILLTLEFLNKKFIINHGNLYDRANTLSKNVFRVKDLVTVDACGNQELKKYAEFTADDYKNMDVWRPEQIYTYNARNRYGNKFPVPNYSASSRHYEKDNDGLHMSNPDRASLNGQLRGYNMENQIKGSTSYENSYYENI
jgi:hypothetical protein